MKLNNKFFNENLSKKDIFALPKEQDNTLLGLPRGEVGVLIAPGATGKSYFTINILLSSCGLTQNHLVENEMKVLYVSLEDQLDDIQRRLHSYQLALWLTEDIVNEKALDFEIVCYKGAQRLITIGLAQEDNPLWINLVEKIQTTLPDLVIVDTLIKTYEGFEENSNPDMSKVLSYFNELALGNSCSVLLLHHTNKAAMHQDSPSSQTNSRGASAIVDNSRWVVSLKKEGDMGETVICEGVKTNFTQLPTQNYNRGYKGALVMEGLDAA